ncbi:hypothetical protein [Psychrobacillus sp. L3]|uniref:hypothetical protein n=1 Tax=Psychrobacillus sp. L3 TaxID=3236891 RepID=UPI0036F42112
MRGKIISFASRKKPKRELCTVCGKTLTKQTFTLDSPIEGRLIVCSLCGDLAKRGTEAIRKELEKEKAKLERQLAALPKNNYTS